MLISKINTYNYVRGFNNPQNQVAQDNKAIKTRTVNTNPFKNIPVEYKFGANINFCGINSKKIVVNVPLIEFENYKAMNEHRKERFRLLYKNFDKIIDDSQREVLLKIDKHPEYFQLPLQKESEMNKFIDVAKMYSEYKEHPIICLGRSPKWFLNTSLWMKDGIKDYKFVAYSGRWYWMYDGDFGDFSGLKRMDQIAPTKAEKRAYRKYLRNIQADPLSIVKNTQKAGQKTIITDYVDTGKGFTSFLEIMGEYAQEQGVLDEFGNSIDILTIGNKEYRMKRKNLEWISSPHVNMPEIMAPFDIPKTPWGTGQAINQKYFDLDYDVFKQMLINQNTNECRSTYYPHEAWTIYQPNKFKTGMIKDMHKIKETLAMLESSRPIYHFEPVMSAYRNLLNFRILDALNARNLLKAIHKTRI